MSPPLPPSALMSPFPRVWALVPRRGPELPPRLAHLPQRFVNEMLMQCLSYFVEEFCTQSWRSQGTAT